MGAFLAGAQAAIPGESVAAASIGDVAIKGQSMLFLNLGDQARAGEFLAQRAAQ